MSDESIRKKPVSLSRMGRNLARIVRSCTPPVLHPLFGFSKRGRTPTNEARPETQTGDQQEPVEFLIPALEPEKIWAGFRTTEVVMTPGQIRNHLWAMPENELLVLSAICQVLKPKQVFEFGTFTGASTLAIAANTPDETRIHTLDIAPENRRSHRTGVGSDIPFDFVIGENFRGTRWESKIEILTGDANNLDTGRFRNRMDLIFVDADHTYPFVRNDTEKALEMLAPGGVILWHDYRWDDDAPECAGVTRWVNEFHDRIGQCVEIEGTRFAIHQSKTADESGAVREREAA